MLESLFFGICAFLAVLLGECVSPALIALRRKIPIPPIPGGPEIQKAWKGATHHPKASGAWVGRVERLAFFFAWYFGSEEAVGIWIAFKVASKWEAWSNLGYTPSELKGFESPVEQLEYSAARRAWTAQNYATFVVGTALNFICASIAFGLFTLYPRIQEFLRSLC